MSIGRFYIGVDLGQSHDFTAMAILERTELTERWDAAAYAHRKMAGYDCGTWRGSRGGRPIRKS